VAIYQVYIIDETGRVRLGDGFDAPDDAEALARLDDLDGPDVTLELWQGGRLLRRRPPARREPAG
jgi:hypothetical protein